MSGIKNDISFSGRPPAITGHSAAFKHFGKVLLPIVKEADLLEIEPKIFPLVRFVRD